MNDSQNPRGQTDGTLGGGTGRDGTPDPSEVDVTMGTADERGPGLGNADESRSLVNADHAPREEGEERATRQELIEKLSEDAGKIVPQ